MLTEITDPTATPGFGYSIFGLGDITGDGLADIAIVDPGAEPYAGIFGQLSIFAGSATATSLDLLDAHRTISNDDSSIRGFAAQVDVMHPDLWLSEPTLQIISLTSPGTGGVNQAPIAIDILEADGTAAGNKGARSSLVLAGDINLDGQVDAADIQDSISQLGTNPQAIGVMPIADSNNDDIIDMTDVEFVVDSYGQTTDIYEGLWDGTRLLSVAASSAGFGSISGIGSVGGGSQFGGGPRPTDGCPPVIIVPPSGGLLLSLLREESRISCDNDNCPTYDESPECYDCVSDKGVSGGSVSVSPEQPLTTETVTFTVQGVTETPGQLKCRDSVGCGSDGATEPTPLGEPIYVWQVLTKTEEGWPEEADPNEGHDGWDTGETTTASGGTCVEKKAICWAKPSGPCVPDPAWTRVGEKAVKFADFKMSSECVVDTPEDKTRTDVGIGEDIEISIVGGGTARWEVNGDDKGLQPSPYTVTAPENEGALTVTAEINGCTRTISLTVIEPSAINYIPCTNAVAHTFGNKDIHMYLKMDLDPDTVSFYKVAVREGFVTASSLSEDYLEPGVAPSHPAGPWRAVREDNTVIGRDHAYADRPADDMLQGSFSWNIPLIYAVGGGTVLHELENQSETQMFVVQPNCVKVSKGGFATPLGCRTSATITPNFAGCGINGN